MDIGDANSEIRRLFNSDEAVAVRRSFLEHISKWLELHVKNNEDDLTGLAVLLADGVIDFSQINTDELEAFTGIKKGLKEAFDYASSQFEAYDQQLDSLHSKFAKDFEDLDLQIVADKDAFRNYLRILTHAEEYYYISIKLKRVHDSVGTGKLED
jgi:hypothetical protein